MIITLRYATLIPQADASHNGPDRAHALWASLNSRSPRRHVTNTTALSPRRHTAEAAGTKDPSRDGKWTA
jgi:hypothetical protein